MSADQEHWVARPGELVTDGVEETATRVGGLPLFPAGCPSPDPALTACQECGKQLALILQAHAPLTAEQTAGLGQPRRFLYVYGCVAEGCGKQPGCWRALRLTAPSEDRAADSSGAAPQQQQEQQQKKRQQQKQQKEQQCVPAPAADDWGVGGADDWGAGGSSDWGTDSGAAAGSAFDFGDLNAALEAVGPVPAKAAPTKHSGGQQTGSSGRDGGAATPVYDAARPSLPAFYLFSEPESQSDSSASSNRQRAEEEHLAQLMARYVAEAAAAGEAADAAAACAPSIEGGPESWGGEGYEEDGVLAPTGGKRAGVGAAYLKFSRRLARCPDQCARYSFGGTPLWPGSQPPAEAPPCAACGGRRAFELQLMTPLIPALCEAAEWLAADPGSAAAAATAIQRPPDSWEWLTVCMYSCGTSCCGGSGSGTALVEELAVLVNEEG